MNPTIKQQLAILEADLSKKSPRTRSGYIPVARRFLKESGDFSRSGMIRWLGGSGYCDNSVRTVYYILKRLCKALDKKFPLDKEFLPPIPDEEEIYTPTTPVDNVKVLIAFWRRFPGHYITSLLFLATVFGIRSIEMTNVEVKSNSIVVTVAKRKSRVDKPVLRTHPIPEDLMKYLSGYEQMSEMTVKYTYWKACRRAGLKRMAKENWHSIRRCLNTAFTDAGINKTMFKRFLRWARDRRDMADVYYHRDFSEINKIMFGEIPIPMSEPPKYVKHPFLPLWR